MSETVIVGSRGSRLALIQAESVVQGIKAYRPSLEVRIEVIKTSGDKVQDSPFSAVGAFGIFVREIENALAEKRIDIAVHSLKDLQTELHPDLIIGAIPERVGACDVLISRTGAAFDQLTPGAVIGTSSARRRGLIAVERKDLVIKECRGNVPTRITKLDGGEFDAIILAEAGLKRMGQSERITERLDFNRFVPAVGQGALGIEVRREDERVIEIVSVLNHPATYAACMEERTFLAQTGGGCHAPVGAHLRYERDHAIFTAFISTCDGKWFAREQVAVNEDKIAGVGGQMADRMRSLPGYEAFLREVTGNVC